MGRFVNAWIEPVDRGNCANRHGRGKRASRGFHIAALLTAIVATTPVLAEFDRDRLSRIDQTFADYVRAGDLPGAVIQINHQGKAVYHRAFGHRDVESGDPMQTDSIFRIASMSKAVVSVAILKLQESGALLIQQPVADFLPAFASTEVAVAGDDGFDTVAANRPITIRDLLTHTAGIGYGYGPGASAWMKAGIQHWYFGHRDEPIRATIDRLAALPMDAQPGERFVYGYNTDILGAIVEVASGQPLDAYLREAIFQPLGMTDTYFYLPKAKAGRLATVYARASGELTRAAAETPFHGQGHYVDGPRKSFSGGAGLVSTTADYSRFLEALRTFDQRLLGRKSVESMTESHIGDIQFAPGAGFGLGFSVVLDNGRRGQLGSAGEYAWGGAYHTTYWVDPVEELSVVYMTQVLPATGLNDHAMLRTLIYQALR